MIQSVLTLKRGKKLDILVQCIHIVRARRSTEKFGDLQTDTKKISVKKGAKQQRHSKKRGTSDTEQPSEKEELTFMGISSIWV